MTGFETSRSQAQALLAQNRAAQALPVLQRLARQRPDDVQTLNLLAIAFNQLGQPATAEHSIRRALEVAPGDPALIATMARTLVLLNRTPEAIGLLQNAHSVHPADATLLCDLALLLTGLGRAREAVLLIRGSTLAPQPAIQAALATSLKRLGRTDEALAAWQAAYGHDPADLGGASGLCTLLNYATGAPPARLLAAHRNFAARLAEVSRLQRPAPVPRPLDSRPLRIGMVGPDFREHSVAYFILPILEHAIPSQARFVLYSCDRQRDDMTRRLEAGAERLRPVHDLPNDRLFDLVRADSIDVLIDLSGLTDGNRLQVFQLRPAPLQITAIGYPNTTGLSAIDWRLVDSITDPPGAESHCVEPLWRLDPCFLCYRPPDGAPPPAAGRPLGRPFMFGSFNALKKINGLVLAAWARILAAVPGSRLLLKNSDLSDPTTRADLCERFAAAGGEPSRLDFASWAPGTAEHLRQYHQLDLSLDTFPYNGTTTTCESLFMGVPVICFAGAAHAGRVGLSLLSGAGLAGLVASDVEGYIRLAARLAADPAGLEPWRRGLRERLLASPLCDGPRYAERFIAGLRSMYAARCPGAQQSLAP